MVDVEPSPLSALLVVCALELGQQVVSFFWENARPLIMLP